MYKLSLVPNLIALTLSSFPVSAMTIIHKSIAMPVPESLEHPEFISFHSASGDEDSDSHKSPSGTSRARRHSSGPELIKRDDILDPNNSELFSTLWEAQDIESIQNVFPFFSSTCYPDMPYNFGVVINNEKYQLFRSQALGAKGVDRLFSRMREQELAEPYQVIFMNKEGYRQNAFLTKFSDYFDVVKGLGPFAFEEAAIFNKGGKYSHIKFLHPLRDRVFLSGQNPLEDVDSPHVLKFDSGETVNLYATRGNFFGVLQKLLANEGASLYHCTGGLHRTGMISLAIRHMQGGIWTHPFHKPVKIRRKLFWQVELKNLAEIEYYLHNSWNFRMVNIISMRTLASQPEFVDLKERYRESLNLPSKCSFTVREMTKKQSLK